MRLSFILLFMLAGACVNHDTRPMGACQVTNPAEDLPWLKAEVAQLENSAIRRYWFVTQGRYEDQSVFVIQNCCPFCSTITPVYNCEGVLLFHLSNEVIIYEKIVWKPADFACT